MHSVIMAKPPSVAQSATAENTTGKSIVVSQLAIEQAEQRCKRCSLKRKKSQFKDKIKTEFKNQSYKSRQTDIFPREASGPDRV